MEGMDWVGNTVIQQFNTGYIVVCIVGFIKESGSVRQKDWGLHNLPCLRCLPHLIYSFIMVRADRRQLPEKLIWMANGSQGLKEDLAYDPPCHPRAVSCFHFITNGHGADYSPVCDTRYIHTRIRPLSIEVNTIAYPRQRV